MARLFVVSVCLHAVVTALCLSFVSAALPNPVKPKIWGYSRLRLEICLNLCCKIAIIYVGTYCKYVSVLCWMTPSCFGVVLNCGAGVRLKTTDLSVMHSVAHCVRAVCKGSYFVNLSYIYIYLFMLSYSSL
jgi:hypothetical protein